MSEFVTFFGSILSLISDFLLTDPIIYFVGLFILGWIAVIFSKLIRKE